MKLITKNILDYMLKCNKWQLTSSANKVWNVTLAGYAYEIARKTCTFGFIHPKTVEQYYLSHWKCSDACIYKLLSTHDTLSDAKKEIVNHWKKFACKDYFREY